MTDSDKAMQLVAEVMADFSRVYSSRPLMLGKAKDVNAMFFLFDQIDFVLAHGRRMDLAKHSWMEFLRQSGHIKGAQDTFVDALEKDPEDFTLMYRLRDEYKSWLESKLR